MQTKKRFFELDALRGVAALMVVFFHFTLGRPEAAYGFKLGITGVDLFFIISGFVITMSIMRVNRGIDFVINRVSRLYPAYWAAVTFTFLLIIGRSLVVLGNLSAAHPMQYVANLTMFQFYFLVPDLDGPYWSLSVEMLFYICILLLLHFQKLRYVNIIGIGLITTLVIVQMLFWSFEMKVLFHVIALLKYLPLFLAGINFYKIYTEQKNRSVHYASIAFCYVSQLLLFQNTARARVFISLTEYGAALTIIFLVFVLFVNGYLKFIINKTTMFLGRISYPLYLTHQLLSLGVLFPFLINYLHLNFWFAAFGITLPIDIILAWAITKYIDEPYSKKMKAWLFSLASAEEKQNYWFTRVLYRLRLKTENEGL